MKLTATQKETLVQYFVTGNAFKATSRTKYSTEILQAIDLGKTETGRSIYLVKPEVVELLEGHPMMKAYRHLESLGFKYDNPNMLAKSSKNMIKVVNAEGAEAWFDWQGDAYQNCTQIIRRGKAV